MEIGDKQVVVLDARDLDHSYDDQMNAQGALREMVWSEQWVDYAMAHAQAAGSSLVTCEDGVRRRVPFERLTEKQRIEVERRMFESLGVGERW